MNDQTNQSQPPKYNPYFDPATDNLPIEEKVIKEVINDPKPDPAGMAAEDQAFLNKVMGMIDQGQINLYQPGSLVNHAVYDSLSEEIKGKADFNATILLSSLRQIHGLWTIGKKDTFQVKNLINQVRLTKERVERDCGDVYVI